LANNKEFIDIASSIYRDISVALSVKDEYFVWGSSAEKAILLPEKTKFKNYHEIFTKHPDSKITYLPIHVYLDDSVELDHVSVGKLFREYVIYKILAFKFSSMILKTKSKLDGKLYVVRMSQFYEGLYENLLNHIRIIENLDEKYVVKIRSVWLERWFNDSDDFSHILGTHLLVISKDFCAKSLREYSFQIQNLLIGINNVSFSSLLYYVICEIFKQLVTCLNYLHSQKPPIVNINLNLTNIMIDKTSRGQSIRISGLSNAIKQGENSVQRPNHLTELYEQDSKIDMFQLGCIINHILLLFSSK
jgi:serine/threonine protein kinase